MRNKYSKFKTTSRKRGRRQSWLRGAASLIESDCWRTSYCWPNHPIAPSDYTLLPMSAAKAGDRG